MQMAQSNLIILFLCQWKLPAKLLTWKRRNEMPLCHAVQGMRYVEEHVEISGSLNPKLIKKKLSHFEYCLKNPTKQQTDG